MDADKLDRCDYNKKNNHFINTECVIIFLIIIIIIKIKIIIIIIIIIRIINE